MVGYRLSQVCWPVLLWNAFAWITCEFCALQPGIRLQNGSLFFMRYQIRDWPTASAEDNRFTAFFNGGYQL